MTETVRIPEGKSDRPYRPSWIDLLTNWVARRPGPPWLYYLGCFLILLLLQILILWIENAPITGSVLLPMVYLAAMISILPALIYFLDIKAQAALETMRPVLDVDEAERRILEYRLTTMPALSTFLVGVGTLVFVFLAEGLDAPYLPEELLPYPVSTMFLRSIYLISWFIFGAFLTHTILQLQAINHIYTRNIRIDILRASPLYAFSNIAALTAGSLAAICNGWFMVNTFDMSNPIIVIPLVLLMLLALIVFILPQVGIHRLQVKEKEKLHNEYALRFESGIKQLHEMIDDEDFNGISDLNTAMGILKIEKEALNNIPTWPWDPEVVRLLITALALPLGLWIIQLVLQRTFTP